MVTPHCEMILLVAGIVNKTETLDCFCTDNNMIYVVSPRHNKMMAPSILCMPKDTLYSHLGRMSLPSSTGLLLQMPPTPTPKREEKSCHKKHFLHSR